MEILTISDIHGRTIWKEANFDRYDRVIFLGDYTDSYVVDDETIYSNLEEIIQLKRNVPDKFVLLIGNHDAQYLHYPNYRCSGFRQWAQSMLSDLFTNYESLFQIAHQQGAYLFTHAGVTNRWLRRLLVKTGHETLSITPEYDVAGLLDKLHRSVNFRNILFEVGPRRGGYDLCGGPVWADRSETKVDYLSDFHQVVGHTPVDAFTTITSEAGSITYTDVLQTKTAFYELVIPD
ncbi:metallophosphoesterase [Spirosoma sp.]|uniref:metallophosphoesterase n=1 Tax=Spirosoma sp. TaxID=1899569 RepID=UPI003B3B2FB7